MLNIAIDGPAGSGKSTIAKFLSKKLNILYLDTGAMYRACGLKALNSNINPKDYEGVETFIHDIDIKVKYEDGTQHTYLDGVDVSKEIRENRVSMVASDISSLKNVRLKMVELQREIAKSTDCVLDGRDIGSYVLPNASHKFYMTASIEERARRRYKELIERGQIVDFEALKKEIETRDYNDSHREFAPLCVAEGAVVIDTSNMSIDEVIEEVLKYLI